MSSLNKDSAARPGAAAPADAPRVDPAALALALIDELPSHVAVLDESGVIVGTSGAWRRFQAENGGMGDRCGVGANYLDVCDRAARSSRDAARVARAIRAVVAGEADGFHHVYECSSPTERRWFQVRVQAMRVPPASLASGPAAPKRLVMVVHQSITEAESRAEERLTRMTEAAHASRLCNIGVAAVELIHEITQPLASVRNYASGSLRRLARSAGTDPAELREVFEVITREVERAEHIIRRARAFAARSDASREPFDLSPALREVLVLWSPHLRSLGSAVKTDESEAQPWPACPVIGDRVQIEQVLINALCNAADAARQAGPAPGAAIEVSLRRGASSVRVEVRDRGPGITPDVRRRLFEPFHTTKPHGLGMGLAISRSIAEAHEGRVELENRSDGAGAVFTLELPLSGGDHHRKESQRHAA